MIDIGKIMEIIPHRYPFLLVDKIIDVKKAESATGIKNVTFNEPHFVGHFPAKPIMPGVLIVEAMAQTSACLVMDSLGDAAKGKLVYFMSIENAKFRRPVVPGDVLQLRVAVLQNRKNVWKMDCNAFVDDNKVAEAQITAMISEE